MAKRTISITEGRKRLFKIAQELQKPDTYYTFTVDGEPRVVLMSQDEFESIMETMEILSDPEIVKDLRKAEEDLQKGNYVSWEEVKKEIGFKEPDLILRDRVKERYKAKKRYGKSKGRKL